MNNQDVDNKIYSLAIKRGKNNYQPLEWHLTNFYKGENLQTLQGIDSFTSSLSEIPLLQNLLDENLLSTEDKFQKFVIIFNEKGRTRELQEGPCFVENAEFLNPDNIYSFLVDHYNDKILMNKIYNYLGNAHSSVNLEEFRYIINNVDYFLSQGEKYICVALSKVKELDYNTLRKIGMYISKKLIPGLNKNTDLRLDLDINKRDKKSN